MGRPFKIVPSMGYLDHHMVPWAHPSPQPRSVELFLQGSLRWQTDRQTTLLGCIYVHSTAMRVILMTALQNKKSKVQHLTNSLDCGRRYERSQAVELYNVPSLRCRNSWSMSLTWQKSLMSWPMNADTVRWSMLKPLSAHTHTHAYTCMHTHTHSHTDSCSTEVHSFH